jgi:hypothetical protein
MSEHEKKGDELERLLKEQQWEAEQLPSMLKILTEEALRLMAELQSTRPHIAKEQEGYAK